VIFFAPPLLPGTSDCVSFVTGPYRSVGYDPPWEDFHGPSVVYEEVMGKKWPEPITYLLFNKVTTAIVLGGFYPRILLLMRTLFPINVVTSIDPNDKAGASGHGTPHYVSGSPPLEYIVYFENLASATGAAQEVVITDQLDVSKMMDLSTCSLGLVAFGDRQIVPPPGLCDFTTNVDLRPGKNLIVRIEVTLNSNTGLLTWRFTSIDPATGQRPEDPLVGFLPPNKNPPEGEGNVVFTVMPKQGLATGTEIRNRATIVFDTNQPIGTPEWLNTLDNTKPQSQVLELIPTQSNSSFEVGGASLEVRVSFEVRWAGTDGESGIKDYTVFVSENGGPFIPWVVNTTATSSIFEGQLQTSYAFYSVARDQVGNVEDVPSVADAMVVTPDFPDFGGSTQSHR
jgi:hypothetical protein